MTQTIHGAGVRANRDVLSREFVERQEAPPTTTIEATLEQLDLALGDDINLSHFGSPWGEEQAGRRHHRLMGTILNPGARSLKLVVRDERETLMNGVRLDFNFRDQSEYGNGMLSVMPHAGLSFWTGGCTITPDPADGFVQRQLSKPYGRTLPRNATRLNATAGGLLLERASYGYLDRAGYVSGLTGLTATAGNSTFAVLTTPAVGLLFRWAQPDDTSSWTSQCIEITAAAAAPTGGGFTHLMGAAAVTAGVPTIFCCDHNDDSGAVLYYRITRVSDGFTWNDSTGVWGAAVVDNAMPVVTDRWARYCSKPLTGPAGTTKYTVTLLQATGGAVSRKNRVACSEIQYNVAWPHSRIVTDTHASTDPNPYAAGATCSNDILSLSNNILPGGWGGSVLSHKRGTFLIKFVRNWKSYGVLGPAGYEFTALSLPGFLRVWYDGTAFQWKCSRTAGGTVTIAASPAVTSYPDIETQDYLVALRWASRTSEGGELDAFYGSAGAGSQQNFDLTVWPATGVRRRANGVSASTPTEVAKSTIQIGNDDDGNSIDAAIQTVRITKYVMTDEELESFVRPQAVY